MISWAYCLLMGGRRADPGDGVAILNANYIDGAPRGHFPILFKGAPVGSRMNASSTLRHFADCGRRDRRRHRQAADGHGLSRADHELAGGRHADGRTHGSETKAELDRFITAMARSATRSPRSRRARSPPRTAPCATPPTRSRISSPSGTAPIRAKQGCFPPGAFRVDKYWPPVGRVDNAWGDRHLVCTCPPVEDYAEAAE